MLAQQQLRLEEHSRGCSGFTPIALHEGSLLFMCLCDTGLEAWYVSCRSVRGLGLGQFYALC